MITKRIEYYVEYFDTVGRRYFSVIFPTRETAEEFEKSMLSQGYINSKIKKQEYFYEETKGDK